MLVSTKGRYALRVMVDMAEHQTEGNLPLKAVAQRQNISEKYLESIVKTLVQSRLIVGVRGKGGGYALTKNPDQYTVAEVLRAVEGSLAPVACLEGKAPECTQVTCCRTRQLWLGLDKVIGEYLEGVTIADLMDTGANGDNYVI